MVAPAEVRQGTSCLGLRVRSTADLVRFVQAGLPYSRLARYQRATRFPWDRVSRYIQIPPRTLARRESEGRLRPDESERLLRAARIYDLAVGLFEGDAEGARAWLERPQRALGGESPAQFAMTEPGAREVERLIGRLEHGIIT